MPVSDPNNITPIMGEILRSQPKRILDLGIGFGKYGVLCREYLDIEQGRLHKWHWETHITGVEGFVKYKNPNWEQYSRVLVEDFSKYANYANYQNFDLVLMIDSLEHIDKQDGMALLMTLLQNNKRVIVSCPTGTNYLEQGAVNGNEYERHRAHWRESDFKNLGGRTVYSGVCVVSSIKGQA